MKCVDLKSTQTVKCYAILKKSTNHFSNVRRFCVSFMGINKSKQIDQLNECHWCSPIAVSRNEFLWQKVIERNVWMKSNEIYLLVWLSTVFRWVSMNRHRAFGWDRWSKPSSMESIGHLLSTMNEQLVMQTFFSSFWVFSRTLMKLVQFVLKNTCFFASTNLTKCSRFAFYFVWKIFAVEWVRFN